MTASGASQSRSSDQERCLIVFSKPGRPGLVKTRLLAELSARQAAALHDAFLGDLLERLEKGSFRLRIGWALDSDEPLPAASVPAFRQRGVDLGDRMYRALADAARRFRRVAAIGGDHPDLPLSLVHQAFDKLDGGADVVLGPARDGGYYLVAARDRSLDPEMFRDIEWSTSRVLEGTLARCRQLGLVTELLPTAGDIDTPSDLRRLVDRLRRHPEIDCPRTRALLDSWSRLDPSTGEGEADEGP